MSRAIFNATDTRLRDLHIARDYVELRDLLTRELIAQRIEALAILIDEDGESWMCEWSPDRESPFLVSRAQKDEMLACSTLEIDLAYGHEVVGSAHFAVRPKGDQLDDLRIYLQHWTTAFVNRRLSDHNVELLDEYSASLQVLEEGVVLLQEHDVETLGARFLGLFSKALVTDIAAVYFLEDAADQDSKLQLAHVTGVPEELLEDLVDASGRFWPHTALSCPAQILERTAEGGFDGLDAGRLTAALHNIVAVPLESAGKACGIAIAFNVKSDSRARARLDSARRLSELGAALFQRVKLENEKFLTKLLENQLNIASRLQAHLVPSEAPVTPLYSFAWSSRPALYVGGDYVDFVDQQDEAVAAIADVSGHGVNSALLMTSFRASCRAHAGIESPAEQLALLNDNVAREVGNTGMFLTAVLARLSKSERKIRIGSAGHNSILVWRHADSEFIELEASGPPLGFIPGIGYEDLEIELAPHDVVLLYTDGVVEAAPPGTDDMFEMDRLKNTIRASLTTGVDGIRLAILRAVEEHAGLGMREDDVSLIVIGVNDVDPASTGSQ